VVLRTAAVAGIRQLPSAIALDDPVLVGEIGRHRRIEEPGRDV
jgi:hypothetical protein